MINLVPVDVTCDVLLACACRCAEKMKSSFDGTLNEPLAALLVISMASDWEFYFIPVQPNGKPMEQ